MDLAPEESSLPTDIQQVGLCVYPGPEQVKDANFDTSPSDGREHDPGPKDGL